MRIVVASSLSAGSLIANAINTVKMAEGFACLGHSVTLVCYQPEGGALTKNQLEKIYGIQSPLRWVQLFPKIAGRQMGDHWSFALLAIVPALAQRPQLIFSRNYIFPWLTSKLGIPTVAESHAHPDNISPEFLYLVKAAARHRSFRLWVTISSILAEHYHLLGVPNEKLAIFPDAVDLNLFRCPVNLPPSPYNHNCPNVVYAGHLYDYKGIPTILKTAAMLPDINFHFIGGLQEDINRQQANAAGLNLLNVTFHGLRPHSEVPPFLWHADVLLLVPTAHHPSAAWTSPMKLGEYLSSGKPVICSDIPALRNWLNSDEAHFVNPDDPKALVNAIQKILGRPDYGKSLAEKGIKKAKTLTFEKRAMAVLEKLSLT